MKIPFCVALAAICFLLTGCGGAYTITRTSAKVPEQLRSASVSPLEEGSPEITTYITEALVSQGVSIKQSSAANAPKSNGADAFVTYSDIWRWDFAMYLKAITINLYKASTGELLVTGRWSDSLFHAYHGGEMVTQELIKQMFAKLELTKNGTEEIAVLTPTPVSDNQPRSTELVLNKKQNTTTETKNLSSRFEYEARQQAKVLQCSPLDITAIDGLGSSREVITLDCSGGRSVTVVCTSNSKCN